MSAPLLKDPEKKLLSEFGGVMEKAGLPDVSGKIFAWLLICDPPCQTSDEIAQALGIDGDLAGQMGEMLTEFGMTEKVSLPDKKCFVVKPIGQMMQQRMGLLHEFRQTIQHSLILLKDQPEKQQRLKDLDSFYGLLEEELPKILACWEAGIK
ncbi:MAG TPA: hypothetical protein DD435_07740 [Cyanobacteria bacterium UBA8530]|nr:hypothetical protein [Cyanobacteria bacterium UBA8530]